MVAGGGTKYKEKGKATTLETLISTLIFPALNS